MSKLGLMLKDKNKRERGRFGLTQFAQTPLKLKAKALQLDASGGTIPPWDPPPPDSRQMPSVFF